LLVRTFAPKNFKKIAANAGKTAHCCRLYDEGSAGIPKWIRPIISRLHGLKFFPAKNFWFESLWAGFFSARNLKKEKKVGAKVGKKDVSSSTNSLLRREPLSGT